MSPYSNTLNRTGGHSQRSAALADLPTLDLIRRVVEENDRESVDELVHHRRVCVIGQDNYLSIGDFLLLLRRRVSDRRHHEFTSEMIDMAYDLTVDKFTCLPTKETQAPDDAERPQPERNRSGVTCGRYYRAILRRCDEQLHENASELAEEADVIRHLQGFLVRHFELSLKEGKRRSKRKSHRYTWRVNGHSLSLYMPRYLTGAEKARWLESNIEDIDASRPGERERVQEIIDQRLPREPAGPVEAGDYGIGAYSLSQRLPSKLDSPAQRSLVEALAEEKAKEINSQRRSIAELGGDRLKQLIRDIFEGLSENKYSDRALARTYKLSPSTFSRFAGSRWTIADRDAKRPIPDLWRNLAGLLAGCEAFREAAQRAGVWGVVDNLINEKPVAHKGDATQGGPG